MEAGTGIAAVAEIARGFRAAADGYADEMVERIRQAIPEFAELPSEPELWDAMRASCLANLQVGLDRMAGEMTVPDEIPAGARELARIAVRLDVDLAPVLRAYRVGHAMMWEAFSRQIEDAGLPQADRRLAQAAASAYLFHYVDAVSGHVTDEYTGERDRFLRSREQRRTQLVRDVLEGIDPDPAEAAEALDYDLRLEHLALVVRGEEPERVVRDLAASLSAPHRLVVSLSGDTAWAWLGRTRPFGRPTVPEAPDGATVAFGEPGGGVQGFRRSHRQARDAHRVALRRGAEVTRYDAVALESLVAGDETRIEDFVSRELRGLDGPGKRARRLRSTLRAYFAAGQNAAAAASMLGVHDHTVAYRLRTIEEEIGRPVTERRAELEVALRLLSMLEGE